MARGHQLRDLLAQGTLPAPAVVRRAQVVIAGGGVAGLAAARSLRLAGVDDFALLELEDTAGGNSRGGQVNGIACPLGAHYLPVPGDDAREVQDLLEELGLRQRVAATMKDILTVTEQTTFGTQQTAVSIGQLTDLAVELKGSVSGFKV